MFPQIGLLVATVVTGGSTADIDSASLLASVQAKVLAGARNIPRYICRQTLVRQTYTPHAKRSQTCGNLPESVPFNSSQPDTERALPNGIPGYTLVSSDRANLDVMVGGGDELFSWPGGGKFATNNPNDLLGGNFAGNGDFAGFMITAFSSGQTSFEYVGRCGPSCVRYTFDVPVGVSRYVVQTPIEKIALGYHGAIDIDPKSAELLAAIVIPTDLSKSVRMACDIRTHMMYGRATLNTSAFTIPEASSREYLDENGWYFSNWTQYTGCREYSAESTLSFGGDGTSAGLDSNQAAPAEAAPRSGSTLELRLATKLDSGLISGGDPVEAKLVRTIQASDGRAIPAGSLVRGHLAQVENTYSPNPGVRFVIRFDTILIGGRSTPVTLVPTGKMDVRGRGVFTFPRERVVLDSNFVSRWRVR